MLCILCFIYYVLVSIPFLGEPCSKAANIKDFFHGSKVFLFDFFYCCFKKNTCILLKVTLHYGDQRVKCRDLLILIASQLIIYFMKRG